MKITPCKEQAVSYRDLMEEGTPFIEFRVCLQEPPELVVLVRALAAVGHQFEEYIKREHAELDGAARLFVKEIRKGSMIFELVPILVAPLLASMDAVLIVDGFTRRFGGTIKAYGAGVRGLSITKSDVQDFMATTALIASDTNGKAIISSATYHETKTTKRVEIEFSTPEAKEALQHIKEHKHELDLPAFEPFEDVLMVFWQSNKRNPQTGKPTGEQVTIESISKKPLAVKYDSELAKDRIKYETTEDEKNLYKKGFFVDGRVERFNGKPVAYRISSVRQVIDLPDDDEA